MKIENRNRFIGWVLAIISSILFPFGFGISLGIGAFFIAAGCWFFVFAIGFFIASDEDDD